MAGKIGEKIPMAANFKILKRKLVCRTVYTSLSKLDRLGPVTAGYFMYGFGIPASEYNRITLRNKTKAFIKLCLVFFILNTFVGHKLYFREQK